MEGKKILYGLAGYYVSQLFNTYGPGLHDLHGRLGCHLIIGTKFVPGIEISHHNDEAF